MKKSMLTLVLLLLAGFSWAEDSAEQQIRAQLQEADARIPVDSISPAELDGFYEVTLDSGELLYATADGQHFFIGHLFRADAEAGLINLTELAQNRQRVTALKQVPEAEFITYPAQGETKASLVVYTDVDCTYCRRLHAEIPELNKLGIEIRYLAFPRQGPNSATYNTMVSIWCGQTPAERNRLMDQVKGGKTIENQSCDNPIREHLQLGQAMGVRGTPALVLEDGSLIPGYQPAKQLAQALGLR
ncbi:DsbC family protein [Nitrincola tapanii]|uniref:Thiol:disulfide interchange protein n=1 Tax=Nitrincola tapanii TaxID=1708751 RepID=A0A5A9WAN8_9GAMM|nr:DsbC family protein [Nitrincola tapanii]KAA0876501.1 DsbC family protein [Nitrincola tapanii]